MNEDKSTTTINGQIIDSTILEECLITDAYHVIELQDHAHEISVLTYIEYTNNKWIFSHKGSRKELFLCVPMTNNHDKVDKIFYVREENKYYYPFLTVVFDMNYYYNKGDNTTLLDDTDVLNTIEKLVIILEGLFSHYSNHDFDLKKVIKSNFSFYIKKEIASIIQGSDGFYTIGYTNSSDVFVSEIGTYCYFFVQKAYEEYVKIAKSLDNSLIDDYYARLLICILTVDEENSFILNYFTNADLYINGDSVSIVNRMIDNINTGNIISNTDMNEEVYYRSFIDNDVYDQMILKIDNYKEYLYYNDNGDINLNDFSQQLLEKHNKINSIISNVDHSIISEGNHNINTSVKNVNGSLIYSWAEALLGTICVDNDYFIEILEHTPDNTDNILDFLYSNEILDYYQEYMESAYSFTPKIVKNDLITLGVSDTKGFLDNTNNYARGLQFFTPYIISRANEYFDHDIDKEIIKQYYQYYMHNNLIKNPFYLGEAYTNYSLAINYMILGYLNDPVKLSNFMIMHPYVHDFIVNQNNFKYLFSLMNLILNNEYGINELIVSNEITIEHIVNTMITENSVFYNNRERD